MVDVYVIDKAELNCVRENQQHDQTLEDGTLDDSYAGFTYHVIHFEKVQRFLAILLHVFLDLRVNLILLVLILLRFLLLINA